VFTFLLTTALVVLTSAQGNQQNAEDAFRAKADKMLQLVQDAFNKDRSNPRLTAKNSHVDRLSRIVGVQRLGDNRVMVEVSVKLTDSDDDQLKASGFSVMSRSGDIATLETEVDQLPELASLTVVDKISAAVKRFPLNDRARQNVGIDNALGQRVVSQTGRGVVIGIIDTGIDFRHLDFTVPGSGGRQTRIKALLDMTVYGSQASSWNYVLPGQSAPIGHLYTESDINAALQTAKPPDQNADPVKQRDRNGHGTHVAGTAAGNGLSSPTPGTYSGMAPEADLIIVKASRENDGSDGFLTTDTINALQFIQQKATELNEPFVINMSLGGQLGPHDGTNPDERAIDNLVNAGAGRAVCVAAGNEGSSSIHASGTVQTGSNRTIWLRVNGRADFLDIYQGHSDRFSVTVRRPDGVTLGPVSYDPSGISFPHGQASDQFLMVFNTNDDKGDADSENDQPHILLAFKPGSPAGIWGVTLKDMDSNPNQAFDAWVEGEDAFFDSDLYRNHLIASPGTARKAITVGALASRSNQTVGSTAWFTSPGPTADGREKPEITAPGMYLYSSRSSDVVDPSFGTVESGVALPTDITHYAGLAGTSMATAVTTGTVALVLQANPGLRSDEIKTYMTDNADHDAFDPIGWNAFYGFGKLNVASIFDGLAGVRKYSISGHIDTGDPFTVVNLSGSRSEQVRPDGNGNFSFTDLNAGGSYTVTASSPTSTFTPVSRTFDDLRTNQTADFSRSARRFKISGRIVGSNGNGISNVSIATTTNSTVGPTITTDASGSYILPSVAALQTYTLTPQVAGHSFIPASKSFALLSSDQEFDFVMDTGYKIEGTVQDQNGIPMSGVPVFISTQPDSAVGTTVLANSQGFYSFVNALAGSTYYITPKSDNPIFITRVISNISSNWIVDFDDRPLAQLKFAETSYSIDEGSGSAVVTVLRILDLTHQASVNYETTDADTFNFGCGEAELNGGNAFGRCDYVTTVGTLTFAPWEQVKQIRIPIVNDTYAEGRERFSITLSNASNATIGLSSAEVIINDNDAVNAPNPVFATPFFVRQHYLDFLGREPEFGEPWSNILNRCSDVNNDPACDRLTVSGAFFGSPEFRDKGAYIIISYQVAFNRLPNYSEFVRDLAFVAGENSKRAALADQYVARQDFTNTFGTMNNSQYVTALMGRYNLTQITTPDPTNPYGSNKVLLKASDLINRLNGVDGTLTRAQILAAIVQSDEVLNIEANNVFVAAQYYGYLRRKPDTTGFNNWISYLSAHPGDFRTMVNGFVNSDEYRIRFGPKP
jgi:subtilisin family serine protease